MYVVSKLLIFYRSRQHCKYLTSILTGCAIAPHHTMKEMHIEPIVLKGMATVMVVVGEAGEDVEEPGSYYHHHCMHE